MNIIKIKDQLKNFIYENFPKARQENIDFDFDLMGGKVIDSLGMLPIIEFIETSFNIIVENDHVIEENFKSISTMAEYIITQLPN